MRRSKSEHLSPKNKKLLKNEKKTIAPYNFFFLFYNCMYNHHVSVTTDALAQRPRGSAPRRRSTRSQ